MSQRLGWIHRLLSRWAFAYAHVDPKMVERVRGLAERGVVVYVMRHRSVADYLLINSLFLRERLPLPQFSNGLAIGWFRPLSWIAARIVERVRSLAFFGQARRQHAADREAAAREVAAGQPILIFLRARATGLLGSVLKSRVVESNRIGEPYLEDVLRAASQRDVFFVPLALFRGRGYRKRSSRLSTLVYSVQEAPNELKKLLTFLFNRSDLSLKIGEEIPLHEFLDRYRREGEERMVRRLARALQLFLYREERVVWGPPLLPKRRVREIVVGGSEMAETIQRVADERNLSVAKVRREAEGYFDEMASNFNGTYFAILAFTFRRIWNRIFQGAEITGLDRVADRIREHPVVLVPCHRSHFDYLILSYIFHGQFLTPPHIAAGINLSFFPMGMLFRGAGAYFIRRTFEGNELYKAVFRHYLAYLIREGYTQEFFIEGGRSRTGKIMTPKLGMLAAIVDAFLRDVRRDLYLVPVSIAYERLVEAEAYKRELRGEGKEKESFRALLRARKLLNANYGKAYVSFGEPISLDAALGPLQERFRRSPDDPAVEEETRHFTLKLGFRLLGEVNAVSAVSAPSIAATVLLSHPYAAIRKPDFLRAARLLLEHAEGQGVQLTGSLEKDRATFRETLAFLAKSGLIVEIADGEGGILHVPDEKRINLDFYKNNTIHLFVLLSAVSHALVRGVDRERVHDDLWWWLDLFRNEFVLPDRERLALQVSELVARFDALGVLREGRVDREHPLIRTTASILQNFREAYWAAALVLRTLADGGQSREGLVGEIQRVYHANLLLGVVKKPEGNTTVTLENALDRFAELGFAAFEKRGRGRWVVRGPAFGSLAEVEHRLAASLGAR